MAEETVPEVAEANPTATVDMEVENTESAQNAGDNVGSEPNGADWVTNGEHNQKRGREEDESEEDKVGVSKKLKVDKSVEEERLEALKKGGEEETLKEGGEEGGDEETLKEGGEEETLKEGGEEETLKEGGEEETLKEGGEEETLKEGGEEEEEKSGPVNLGPKTFGSSPEMFNYFYKFLHHWPPYLNVNKYEHIMLLELLKKGHAEPNKKIGGGIRAFQIRNHPVWKSRCFFLVREDDSVDDFSFRKCVDHILPLPEEMQLKSHVNKVLGGGGGKGHGGRGGGGRGGGRGRGKGGRWKR